MCVPLPLYLQRNQIALDRPENGSGPACHPLPPEAEGSFVPQIIAATPDEQVPDAMQALRDELQRFIATGEQWRSGTLFVRTLRARSTSASRALTG